MLQDTNYTCTCTCHAECRSLIALITNLLSLILITELPDEFVDLLLLTDGLRGRPGFVQKLARFTFFGFTSFSFTDSCFSFCVAQSSSAVFSTVPFSTVPFSTVFLNRVDGAGGSNRGVATGSRDDWYFREFLFVTTGLISFCFGVPFSPVSESVNLR